MEIKKDKESRWFNVELVPESYIFSPTIRPQNLDVATCDSTPVIDLAKHIQPIQSILKASQEFGFFQVINHGVPEKIISDAMSVLKEFFDMPSKEATGYVPHNKGWIYTNNDCTKDGVHIWRENLKHLCHPLDKCTKLWPNKPTRYQEVIAAYLLEINKLSFRILEMICEGLGLEPGYLSDTSEVQILSSNFYPSCPDPSLTLGILAHQDTSLITLVYQGDSTGLQFVKDGQWINVGSIPNSFVVNIGNQLEVGRQGYWIWSFGMDAKQRNQIYESLGSLARKCIFGILSVAPLPNHIAFIMDGNRRYSKQHNLIDGAGHRVGFSSLMSMLRYCYELGVKYVTIYAFSIENFKRSPEEVQSLMDLMEEKIEGLIKEESLVNQYGVRVYFIGNLKLLSKPVRLAAERAMDATAKNSKAVLLICIAYTSTDEISHAVHEACEEKWDEVKVLVDCETKDEKNNIDVADIERHMYMAVAPDPDIIIRTSGETRLSNFLLWQSSSCLLYSPSILWPEIGFRHLVKAILDFQNHLCYFKKQKQT